MESPGGFSLQGLGEPLRQLRELIKDFWFRNKQQARQGEQDLARGEQELRKGEQEIRRREQIIEREGIENRLGQQELERGEIALLRERLQLIAEYNLPEAVLRRLAEATTDDIDDLRALAETGRLRLPPPPPDSETDRSEHLKEPARSVTKRKRKKSA